MKWPAGARKGNRSSCCHGSRCIATLGIINDTKITTHLYPIGFSGVGVGSSEWAPFYTISHFFVVSLFFSSNYERTTQDNLHVLQTTLLCWIYVRHGNILHWISKAPLSPIPLFFYHTSSFTHFLIIGSICCKMAQLFRTSHAHALLHTLSVPGQRCSEGMRRQS